MTRTGSLARLGDDGCIFGGLTAARIVALIARWTRRARQG